MKSEAYNMDCMEYMRQFPDKYFELAVVDPPYGIGVTKMNFIHRPQLTAKQKDGSKLRVPRKKKATYSEWDSIPPNNHYFDELVRVSKAQIIFGINHFNWGRDWNGIIKWDKCVPDKVSFSRYEFAYCSLIDFEYEVKLLFSGMQQSHSLLNPITAGGNKSLNEKRIHPTQKPVLLYRKIFMDFAKPGDKILDTHLGSGSSRIAAYEMGFDFYATELDKIHFSDQEKRFQNFKSQLKLAL